MRFDYVLVGGGLQSALIVLALRDRQPNARLAVVEQSDALGGNHTWSFHDTDLTESAHRLVAPLVGRRWTAQEVRFPGLRRTIPHGYASISSPRLDEVVRDRLEGETGSALFTGCPAADVGARSVRLADGRVVDATAVVDARGPAPSARGHGSGFQKFLGLEVTLTNPTRIERPVVMDATVDQIDGFRFVYVLPLADDRLLVEDTYYSADAALDRDALRARARAYAREQGWSVREVEREETGVLPLPWRGPLPRPTPPLRAGYAGGFFHPVTGYSLPIAARLAELVASLPPERLHGPELGAFVRRHAGQARFARLLNWLMFRAWPPPQRWRILERFYREMPEQTIARFYALDTTWSDRARLLLGRPPRGFSLRHAWGSRSRR